MWAWILSNSNGIIAVASSCGLISLVLIFWQIYSARTWNKLNFTYTFFPDPFQFEELESYLDDVIKFWKRDEALSELEVKAILSPEKLIGAELEEITMEFSEALKKEDPRKVLLEANRKLKLYMNQIESYCAAIRAGIIDSDSAKALFDYKFNRAFIKAKPWIDKLRTMKVAPSLYVELEIVLKEWYPEKKTKKKF